MDRFTLQKKAATASAWLRRLLWVVLLLGLSGGIFLLTLMMQPNDWTYTLHLFTYQPLLLVLNFLPVLLLMVILTALTGNLFYGAGLTEFIWCGFSLINRIKCNIRQEPFYPRDFALLREVGKALDSYDIDLPLKRIALVFGLCAVLIVAGFLLRRRMPEMLGRKRLSRFLILGVTLVLSVVLTVFLYGSDPLYISFDGVHYFSTIGTYNNLGFPYSFCYNISANSVDKPEGFDRQESEGWDLSPATEFVGEKVNVVIVMNESFTDITENEAFTYSAEEDPIAFYHSLIERDDVISGHLVVPNLGGGTANTEFDVFTGIQFESLSKSTSVAYRTINSNKDSIFRLYEVAGYSTAFIHPGDHWFYNRSHILPWLGVEDTLFVESLDNGYVNNVPDDDTADLTIAKFEEATADGSPAFHFTTTIQNHMHYTLDKYGQDYPLPPLRTNKAVDEEREMNLAVYIEGLRYADKSLQKQITYFESCGKPVVFLFFGDHYPYLGPDGIGYTQLGMDGENREYPFSLYDPPYLIWANEAAQEILDWDNLMAELALPEHISACYLGVTIAEITGMADTSPWYTFLAELRREVPVLWQGNYQLADSTVRDTLPSSLADEVAKWRKWSYYRMQCKKITD